jgi:hypothetical protein
MVVPRERGGLPTLRLATDRPAHGTAIALVASLAVRLGKPIVKPGSYSTFTSED